MLLLYFFGIIMTVVILTVCVFVFVHSYYCTLYLLHIHMSFSGTVSGNISVCAEIAAKFCQRAASSAGVSLGQDHGC